MTSEAQSSPPADSLHDRYRSFPLFRTLNATQLRNFVAACEPIPFASGDTFIRQASRGDRIYFIGEGEVRGLSRNGGR